MPSDKLNKLWLLAVFILITIILTNSLFIWLRSSHGQPVTVLPPPEPGFSGEIYIDGAVGRPGIYPLNTGESLESLIRACGGAVDNADLSAMRLYIPQRGESPRPQKIDINRADAWLLQALPGIGEVRAQAIIDYRLQFGPFKHIEDLANIPGISNSVFEKIKDYITIRE